MEKGGGQDQLISIQCYHYIITVPLLCLLNQCNGFYIIATLA